jgi:hypothetical protein
MVGGILEYREITRVMFITIYTIGYTRADDQTVFIQSLPWSDGFVMLLL